MDTGNCIEHEYKSLNCRPHSSINNNIIGPQTLERCEDISIIRRDRAGYSSGGKYNTIQVTTKADLFGQIIVFPSDHRSSWNIGQQLAVIVQIL